MNYFIWGVVGFGALMSILAIAGVLLSDEPF